MKGWKYGVLEDVVLKGSSNVSLSKIRDDDGDYPVFGAKGFVQNVSFFQQEQEYLAIIKDGAGIGRVSKHPSKSSVLATMQYLIPKKRFDIDFIRYFLNGVNFEKYRTGSTIPHIYFKDYKAERFPILPLPEQERIVAMLDEAFAAIDTATANTEKNLANAKELFDSILSIRLNTAANGSEVQALDDLAVLIVDCEHKTAPTQETGYPSIRTPNIGRGYLLLDGVRRVSEETYQAWTRRAKPEPGDLILAREAPAGNVAIIPEGEFVCLGQRTVLIRPDISKVESNYLANLILHPDMQKKLLSKSTGATVQHVNMRDIRSLKIAKLPNISEQIKIVEHLKAARDKVDTLVNNINLKVSQNKQLKQSLLQKAFTGELTADSKVVDCTLSEASA
jgi:type I restriction enzyme, S subunit